MSAHSGRAMPEESPLLMSRHEVAEQGFRLKNSQQTFFYLMATLLARLFVFVVTVGLSVYGISEMYGVLTTNTVTSLQLLFLVLFSINFIWIAFAFAQALLGFLLHLKPRLIKPGEVDAPFKTAILLFCCRFIMKIRVESAPQ